MVDTMENTDQGTTAEPTEPTQQEPVDNSAIRQSNLFKSMASEVTRLKKLIEERESVEAEKKKQEEVAQLENESKYKEALAKLTNDFNDKLTAKESELSSLLGQIEHKDITQKLIMSGANSTKASDFLANEYKAIEGEDKPDLETWINTIKEDSEYVSFFSGGETTQQIRTPDVGGNASRKTGKVELDPSMSAAEMLEAALKSM